MNRFGHKTLKYDVAVTSDGLIFVRDVGNKNKCQNVYIYEFIRTDIGTKSM
jgi:hypothetical protein